MREGGGGPNAPEGDWCPEEDLPEETRCKLEGLKCMARWLLGLKRDELSAQKTFRMLNAFIVHKGDLLQVCREASQKRDMFVCYFECLYILATI